MWPVRVVSFVTFPLIVLMDRTMFQSLEDLISHLPLWGCWGLFHYKYSPFLDVFWQENGWVRTHSLSAFSSCYLFLANFLPSTYIPLPFFKSIPFNAFFPPFLRSLWCVIFIVEFWQLGSGVANCGMGTGYNYAVLSDFFMYLCHYSDVYLLGLYFFPPVIWGGKPVNCGKSWRPYHSLVLYS